MRGEEGGSEQEKRKGSQARDMAPKSDERTDGRTGGQAKAYKFHEIYDMFPQKFIALQIEERYESNVGRRTGYTLTLYDGEERNQ